MIMPNTQNLRAKLSPEAQKLGDANRPRNLKSALQLAYKTVRDRIQRSYSKNKRYYDRTAQEREIQEGDIVYVYNPAKKPNVSRKFAPVWDGPCKVKQKKGKLNFRIEDAYGKETVVHINRLKTANDQSIWQPKRKQPRPGRKPRARQETEGDDAEVVISTDQITLPVPQVEPRPADQNTPTENSEMYGTKLTEMVATGSHQNKRARIRITSLLNHHVRDSN
jgi:hypothetical protein